MGDRMGGAQFVRPLGLAAAHGDGGADSQGSYSPTADSHIYPAHSCQSGQYAPANVHASAYACWYPNAGDRGRAERGGNIPGLSPPLPREVAR